MKKKNFWLVFLIPILLFTSCKNIELNNNNSNPTLTQPESSNIDAANLMTEEEGRQHLEETEAFDIDPIKLAWFYKPPKDNDLEYLAKKYEVFILTKLDEEVRDKLIIDYGVTSPILRYIRFDAIMDPGSCLDQPYRNQVADEIGDFWKEIIF